MTATIVIGGGPAGLMAAEQLLQAGMSVDLYDAMPSVGRKLLLAGIGGLNITHSEPWQQFLTRYPFAPANLINALNDFDSSQLRQWVAGLGIETFVGSSGRVFPREMKAAPLLRRWLQRLRNDGLRIHVRHRMQSWQQLPSGKFQIMFDTTDGVAVKTADCLVMALGGASWAKLGSDGLWMPGFESAGIDCQPFQASNCGFNVHWSSFMQKVAGEPLKDIAINLPWLGGYYKKGEAVISNYGIEGSLIYALSSKIRQQIVMHGCAVLNVDLMPHKTAQDIKAFFDSAKKTKTLTQQLRQLGLSSVKIALFQEILKQLVVQEITDYARLLKSLPITLISARPIDEAISCAGGVAFPALSADFMVTGYPGLFCAGEMLDWDAPTGGYLLTATFATGRKAGQSAALFCKTCINE